MNNKPLVPTFRDEKFGKTYFERLESFLLFAYSVCKDIDSTDLAEHWPEDIRMHVAEAYNLIYELNRPEVFKAIHPDLFKELDNL